LQRQWSGASVSTASGFSSGATGASDAPSCDGPPVVGSKEILNRTARTLSLRGVRAVTFSLAFATRLAMAGRPRVAKFLRQHAVILNIDKLIPFPDVLPEPPLMAHS